MKAERLATRNQKRHSMTKKHYEAIAAIIADVKQNEQKHHHAWRIAEKLAEYFASDNANFKKDLFFTASDCEVLNKKSQL